MIYSFDNFYIIQLLQQRKTNRWIMDQPNNIANNRMKKNPPVVESNEMSNVTDL